MDLIKPKRIAFLGGYPPRLCGIATFNYDLCEAVAASSPDSTCFVVAVNDRSEGYDYASRVGLVIDEQALGSYRGAADFLNLNSIDLLVVQHEFGIYGGAAGSHLLSLLKEVKMPIVTVMHTLLSDPNDEQRLVMDDLVRRSDRLVVMAQKGVEILQDHYQVSRDKIALIPHGILDLDGGDTQAFKEALGIKDRKVLLTFGLLNPGKGIEYVIEALPEIVSRHPNVVYLILGATHPHLIAQEGEIYRLKLELMVENLGVKDNVVFCNQFFSIEDLQKFIAATDIYITPYLNEAQITSGTLAFVFGSGKAVVSTPYWHATELLAEGRGLLVPFRDSAAISESVCRYLDDDDLFESVSTTAYELGRLFLWPVVAQTYLDTFTEAVSLRADIGDHPPVALVFDWRVDERPLLRLDHILNMTDDTGIFQHAIFTVPKLDEGYCVDDNARAYILTVLLHDSLVKMGTKLESLANTYLAFIAGAMNPGNGRFRNFMSYSRQWLESYGSEDSHARTLWAMGIGAGKSAHFGHQQLCAHLFKQGMWVTEAFTSPRSWAFILLGAHEFLQRYEHDHEVAAIRTLFAEKLRGLWGDSSTENWLWYEHSLTYENARLCQALIVMGHSTGDAHLLEVGLQSLQWLLSVQKSEGGYFRPIGSNGFYARDSVKAHFDQQPVEAQAMIAAFGAAFGATKSQLWLSEAQLVFEWFLGRNDLGLSLYDPRTGGCRDGLHGDRLNENQGAESTLAYYLSYIELRGLEKMYSSRLEVSL